MKTKTIRLFTIAISASLLILSCTKDNTISSCQLIEIINKGNSQTLRSYRYNTQNNIIQIRFGNSSKTIEYIYLDNQIDKILTNASTDIDSCLVDQYVYDNSNKLIRIEHGYSNNGNCTEEEIFGTTEYFYGNNEFLDSSVLTSNPGQNVIQYDKIVHYYDENENVLQIKRFIQNELFFTTTYTYDDSNNPLVGFLQNGKNNAITEYNLIPSTQMEITYSYNYSDFNELNIPSKMIERNSNDIYIEKEYEYNLSCE